MAADTQVRSRHSASNGSGSSAPSLDTYDHLFKILLIGDSGVGKSTNFIFLSFLIVYECTFYNLTGYYRQYFTSFHRRHFRR